MAAEAVTGIVRLSFILRGMSSTTVPVTAPVTIIITERSSQRLLNRKPAITEAVKKARLPSMLFLPILSFPKLKGAGGIMPLFVTHQDAKVVNEHAVYLRQV